MIDWDKVTELRAEIGDEDFVEVVDLFLDEVDGAIQELRDGVADGQIEDSLHFLKGSALNLGFRVFSALCADGESAAMAGNFDRIDLNEIIRAYDRSKVDFLAELETRLAA
jgi:HPt (histidine-containing phosphotransfer) domain-containing protein